LVSILRPLRRSYIEFKITANASSKAVARDASGKSNPAAVSLAE
jgi:hypothetical protein